MKNKLTIMLGLAGALALAACGSDKDPPRGDGGPGADKGGISIPDGGTLPPDGGTLPPDSGGQTGLTCPEIMQCVQNCAGDQTCAQGCVGQGTVDAQAKINAVATCVQGASQGACKDKCPTLEAPECDPCISQACKAETDACLGGGGPAQEGFGDGCDLAAPQCKTGFTCIGVQGGTEGKGFCTKGCTNAGALCDGAPAGTLAACVLGPAPGQQGSNSCAFLCEVGGKQHTCPSTLTCSQTEQPPSSGQKPCLP